MMRTETSGQAARAATRMCNLCRHEPVPDAQQLRLRVGPLLGQVVEEGLGFVVAPGNNERACKGRYKVDHLR